MTKELTLRQLVEDAIADLREWRRENPCAGANEYVDVIWDIADSSTPVYFWQCLRIAADNLSEIGSRVTELVAAEASPAHVAQLAIFEYLRERLEQEWGHMMEEESIES